MSLPEVSSTELPNKRYFSIGEVSEFCGVKPHVLRYWEQEFSQLKPLKRRGNRRYYQAHEVQMVRMIRELLYDQGFTIMGARNKLQELLQWRRDEPVAVEDELLNGLLAPLQSKLKTHLATLPMPVAPPWNWAALGDQEWQEALAKLRDELQEIRQILA